MNSQRATIRAVEGQRILGAENNFARVFVAFHITIQHVFHHVGMLFVRHIVDVMALDLPEQG